MIPKCKNTLRKKKTDRSVVFARVLACYRNVLKLKKRPKVLDITTGQWEHQRLELIYTTHKYYHYNKYKILIKAGIRYDFAAVFYAVV